MSVERATREVSGQDRVLLSVERIIASQSPNGAIIASPDFAEYQFCWLRDASFCSYALDVAGRYEASARYHEWVRRAVDGITDLLTSVTSAGHEGKALDAERMPPARFSLDGAMVHDDWPNFQTDGYGTWLWSLREHLRLSGRTTLPADFVPAVTTVASYIEEFALAACYDVWEEHGSDQHTSTLACIFGGLQAASRLLEDDRFARRADEVRSSVLSQGRATGHFVKSSADHDVDGSIVWLSAPFEVVGADDAVMECTVELIEERLTLGGGIRRYPTDVYFGSGAWPVLTASLGWHYVRARRWSDARRCLHWVGSRFDAEGRLGEQFGGETRDAENYDFWIRKWGHPARDLVWSHAMFVILADALTHAPGAESGDQVTPVAGAS